MNATPALAPPGKLRTDPPDLIAGHAVAEAIARNVIEPMFNYLQKLGTDARLIDGWSVYIAAAFVNPQQIAVLTPNGLLDELNPLRAFPFVDEATQLALFCELAEYKKRAPTFKGDGDELLAWWLMQPAELLSAWKALALRVALIPTSSTAQERVFAITREIKATQDSLSPETMEQIVLHKANATLFQ